MTDAVVFAGLDSHVLSHPVAAATGAASSSHAKTIQQHKVVLSRDALLIKAQLMGMIRGRVAQHARAGLRRQWRQMVRQGRQVYKQQQPQRIAYLLSADRKQLWSMFKAASHSIRSCRLGPSAAAWTSHLRSMFFGRGECIA